MYTQPRDKFQESDIYIKNTKNIRGVIKKFVDCLYKIKTPKDKSMKI